MEAGSSRIAQVFVWRQGSVPDLAYARRVLSAVNLEAYAAAAGEKPPVQLLSLTGMWPDQPWDRILEDMLTISTASGTHWTNTDRYELEGWQGTDSRTGDKLFVVTVYERPVMAQRERFVGTGVRPPFPSTQASPYGLQPTGQIQGQYSYPAYPGVPSGGIYGQHYTYPYGYNPMPVMTGAFPIAPVSTEAHQPVVPPDYAQFYVGFGGRLAAVLIDAFFLLLPVVTIGSLLWVGTSAGESAPRDFWEWLATYGPFICLGLLAFSAYHVIGWSLYGRTWGKALMGMRVVQADGSSPEFGHSLLRILGYFISTASLGSGFLMIALDARRQGLHDKIAETYVVPDKPATSPPLGLPGYRAAQQSATTGTGVGYMLTPPPATSSQPALAPNQQTPEAHRGPNAFERASQRPVIAGEQPEDRNRRLSSGDEQAQTGEPQRTLRDEQSETFVTSIPPSGPLGPVHDVLVAHEERERPEQTSDADRARALFRDGMSELERGVRKGRDRGLMDVDPAAARSAADRFRQALELVPAAIAYRYFYAVALRYSEGFEVAIGEFSRVLELDPGHFEARQQIAFGPRWHDAFAYPSWGDPNHSGEDVSASQQLNDLLALPRQPGTRLVLLRNGTNKMVAALSRTPRDSWAKLPTPDMPARIELVISRTPSGPVVAFYLIVQDDPDNPFKGETFLNPHDPGLPSDDACQLGQHILEQLAQQDHTYLIFVDESDHLLLSRRLVFGAAAQVNIARILYEVQGLPAQVMDPVRFQQAAQWHMEHFPLDQVK